MLIFTERVKLFARDLPAQAQPFRARADPLAGPDFTGGIIIVLCQMLVEVALGIGQIFMGNGCEHITQHYLFSQKALFVFRTTFNFPNIFIFRFVILSADKSSKVSLGHKMRPSLFPGNCPAESKLFMRQFYRMRRPLLCNGLNNRFYIYF
jgi:hypothetical protein